MNGMFTFDAPLYIDRDGVYCSTTITNEMLQRYLDVVDKLYVAIRTEHIGKSYKEMRLSPLKLDNLEIIGLPNFNSPKEYICRQAYKRNVLKEKVCKTDLFFLRMPSVISDMVAALCRECGKPYLVEVGGCAWDSFWNHGIQGKLIAPVMFYNARKTIANASFATYVTTKWLQHRYPCKCESIAASNVYLAGFDEENIAARLERYKADPMPKKIGTIAGVDVRYKGQEYVIRALARIKDKGISMDYELVGRGEPAYLRSVARKYGVEDQVHYLGLKVHSDIWAWLDTIDIYAQPSKQEGLPRAVIEAMNRGCLAIGSTTAGLPELLEDDMAFRCTDVDAIADTIMKLCNETDHSGRIKRNFEVSKEYDVRLLDARRNNLFQRYRNSISNAYNTSQ